MRNLVILVCLCAVTARAQEFSLIDRLSEPNVALPEPAILFPEDGWYSFWYNLQGSFLEPNRFAIVYDVSPERVRLEAGFGAEVIQLNKTGIGGEILVWSGLKTLDNFRFPVETADYFFGLYSISELYRHGNITYIKLRTRLSHISSHFVDGTRDSIIGGSSSKFSREFVSVEAQIDNEKRTGIIASVGLKYVFHQVEKSEPAIQIPITFDYRILELGRKTSLHGFISTAGGASLPVYSAGLIFQHKTQSQTLLELYSEYHSGQSRYGVEGDRQQSGFEIGFRLGSLPNIFSR